MANFYGYGPNQNMINQLMRQKENIDNMISQYSQPQQPIQNIINTGVTPTFEAKILKDGEEVDNVFINNRTMFLDKKNKKVIVKEVDGKISEEYDIVVPLDEKDKKILDLQTKLEEMENKINEYSKLTFTDGEQQQPDTISNELVKSTTKTSGKQVSGTTK